MLTDITSAAIRPRLSVAVVAAVMAMASPGFAQNKYDVFVGQYMAAYAVAAQCEGLAHLNVQGAGHTSARPSP